MLVIDKPAGLPVHRGPKGGANLEASFDGLRFGLPRPPVLAHRLDKDTSGCLVLGRHRKATASLGLLFKHGKIAKTYWAVVEGGPAEEEGTIDMPLGRLNAERGWWQKPTPRADGGLTGRCGRRDGLCWLPGTVTCRPINCACNIRLGCRSSATTFWHRPALGEPIRAAFPRDRASDFARTRTVRVWRRRRSIFGSGSELRWTGKLGGPALLTSPSPCGRRWIAGAKRRDR